MIQESSSDNFRETAKKAYSRPLDRPAVDAYFAEYALRENHDVWDEIKYHQLKFLRDPRNPELLNRLAGLFVKTGKPSLARMCLLESLRRDATQHHVFERVRELEPFSAPLALEDPGTGDDKISVLMPTYDRGALIRESIESVLNQSYQNFELLIGNDGGLAETGAVVESFRSEKIRYFYFSENKGRPAVINELARRATGRYIAYLDDDDVYYPGCLAKLRNAVENSGLPLAYGRSIVLEGDVVNGRFRGGRTLRFYGGPFERDSFLTRTLVTTCAVLHEKSLFREFGLLNEDFYVSEDWEFCWRILGKYDFACVDELVAEYRIRADNVTRSNAVGTGFMAALMPNYHYFQDGRLALAKYFIHKRDRKKARRLFDEVKNNFWIWPRSRPLFDEFLEVSLGAGDFRFTWKLLANLSAFSLKACARALTPRRSVTAWIMLGALAARKLFVKMLIKTRVIRTKTEPRRHAAVPPGARKNK
jgi:glycosyltransferase involved in cell wall biosynthesis